MTSNVYTKNEILQNLASRGHDINAFELDDLIQKWQIEAIFEDEQGCEFFDKQIIDVILKGFEPAGYKQQLEMQKALSAIDGSSQDMNINMNMSQSYTEVQTYNPLQNSQEIQFDSNVFDNETNNLLNNISLSENTNNNYDEINIIEEQNKDITNTNLSTPEEKRKMGILEGAMLASGQEYEIPKQHQEPQLEKTASVNPEIVDEEDFDDMSLLSESFEAQEKFREYVVSELSKKNMDLTPATNEFKLDISEKTLDMIAKSMAKKIAHHVSQICSADAKTSAKLANIQEKNERLEKKLKELEEQNKKLRLLLVESNRNLNSYKPSILGLYKKVTPGKQ